MGRAAPPNMSRRLLAGLAAAAAAALLAGCAGRAAGNDTPKRPGEQNPARNGPPYEH